MKGFAITNKYLEKISEKEIKGLIFEIIKDNKKNNLDSKYEIKTKAYDSAVVFEINNYNELAYITYKAQSINRVCLLLKEIEITTLDQISEEIKKIDFSGIKEMINGKSFKIECERTGNHDFKSVDAEICCGKSLNESMKKFKIKNKTDYNNPEVIFYFFINEKKGYFGLDFSGFDLSKRQYKIFNHPESLKGNVAYSLIRLSGFEKNMSLLDPFMGCGTIVIEAGIYATGFPIQYYNKDKLSFTRLFETKKFFESIDKKTKKIKKTNIYGYDHQIRYLKASQKNAKLAGIDKAINLSKCDIEWIDTKFEKNSIDLVITDPPRYSKHKERELSKLYNEFFYQSEFILKENGKIILFLKENDYLKKEAEKHNFKIVNRYSLSQGKENFDALIFEKTKKVIT